MKSETMKSKTDDLDDNRIKELISRISCAPDDFKHLQIFLHRDREIDYHSENEYLMVTPRCFGKVSISNLQVVDDSVLIEFYDCGAKEFGTVCININEKKPSALFINWIDIKSLVGSDICTSIDNSGILEFDF